MNIRQALESLKPTLIKKTIDDLTNVLKPKDGTTFVQKEAPPFIKSYYMYIDITWDSGCTYTRDSVGTVKVNYNKIEKLSKDDVHISESMMTNERPMKYNLIVHAEMNAVLFANRDLRGCTVYCTHASCENCLKHLLQAGIRNFVFASYEPTNRASDEAKQAIVRLITSTNSNCFIRNSDGTYESYCKKIGETHG